MTVFHKGDCVYWWHVVSRPRCGVVVDGDDDEMVGVEVGPRDIVYVERHLLHQDLPCVTCGHAAREHETQHEHCDKCDDCTLYVSPEGR